VRTIDEGAAPELVVDAQHTFEGRAGELGTGGGHGCGDGEGERARGGEGERGRKCDGEENEK
jgi:hypothetical protein